MSRNFRIRDGKQFNVGFLKNAGMVWFDFVLFCVLSGSQAYHSVARGTQKEGPGGSHRWPSSTQRPGAVRGLTAGGVSGRVCATGVLQKRSAAAGWPLEPPHVALLSSDFWWT